MTKKNPLRRLCRYIVGADQRDKRAKQKGYDEMISVHNTGERRVTKPLYDYIMVVIIIIATGFLASETPNNLQVKRDMIFFLFSFLLTIRCFFLGKKNICRYPTPAPTPAVFSTATPITFSSAFSWQTLSCARSPMASSSRPTPTLSKGGIGLMSSFSPSSVSMCSTSVPSPPLAVTFFFFFL